MRKDVWEAAAAVGRTALGKGKRRIVRFLSLLVIRSAVTVGHVLKRISSVCFIFFNGVVQSSEK